MKRNVSLLLALLFVLTLALSACGPTGQADPTQAPASTQPATAEPTEEPAPTQEPEEPETPPDPVEADLYVPFVTAKEDFIRGTDVSSLLSILNSGAHYYDADGDLLGDAGDVASQGEAFMALMAASGVNWIRLRVWNDPYDADGNGYGGGNCDIDAAVTMGGWATKAGLKVLIDFHYSDFWADPGRQLAPKAWEGMDVDAKADAMKAFTVESLTKLKDAGVDVGMVQVGNETVNAISGETNWTNVCKLMSAGSAGVREVFPEALVALHFTNAQNAGFYAETAASLAKNGVDYDVFASSYYPIWHGSIENLTSVLKEVADTYGKKVMVAETAWAYTLEDGDDNGNTMGEGYDDTNGYPISVQGQALEFAAVAQAVKDVGSAGLGLFYWENAWIPVGSTRAQNLPLWEEYGSGWATSYAKAYDPDNVGDWYGGSACDNWAMFDFSGKALPSLNVFNYITTGTTGYVNAILSAESPAFTVPVNSGSVPALPETVTVTYTDGTAAALTVAWNETDVSAIDIASAGKYTVNGTVTDASGETFDVRCTVTVAAANLLSNPGFEEEDMSMYTASGWHGDARANREDNAYSGEYYYHFWAESAFEGATVQQTVSLEPGEYTFSLYAQGGDTGDKDIHIFVSYDGAEQATKSITLDGWHNWKNPSVTFTLDAAKEVSVGVSVSSASGGWGTVDDLALFAN